MAAATCPTASSGSGPTSPPSLAASPPLTSANRPFFACSKKVSVSGSDESGLALRRHHPCLRAYGSCRVPSACPFRHLPATVCLPWLLGAAEGADGREGNGGCPLGLDCPLVHRLPSEEGCGEAGGDGNGVGGLVLGVGEEGCLRSRQLQFLIRLRQGPASLRRDPNVIAEGLALSRQFAAGGLDCSSERQERWGVGNMYHPQHCNLAPPFVATGDGSCPSRFLDCSPVRAASDSVAASSAAGSGASSPAPSSPLASNTHQ